jgi:hypothetical protein
MKFTESDKSRFIDILVLAVAVGLLSYGLGFKTALGIGLMVWVLLPDINKTH